jgi:hypothetical protein
MLKDFIVPDWKKLITYMLFIILFMGETLILRSMYHRDYIVVFLVGFYNNILQYISFVNFFMVSFSYYIMVLASLYLLSCVVILILGKIEK